MSVKKSFHPVHRPFIRKHSMVIEQQFRTDYTWPRFINKKQLLLASCWSQATVTGVRPEHHLIFGFQGCWYSFSVNAVVAISKRKQKGKDC